MFHVDPLSRPQGLHKTTFSEALISALLALIIWPCTLLHGFFAGAMAARTLNPRSTYVAESRKKAKPNESLPIRNARCNTELIVAPQGARTLRELWELSVVKHWNLPCIHMRPVLREVTQKEVGQMQLACPWSSRRSICVVIRIHARRSQRIYLHQMVEPCQ